MQNYDQILAAAEDLTQSIRDNAPCGCTAADGYIQALTEVIELLNLTAIPGSSPAAQAAILADREALLKMVQFRLDQVAPQAEPEPAAEPEFDFGKLLLDALAEGRVRAIRL